MVTRRSNYSEFLVPKENSLKEVGNALELKNGQSCLYLMGGYGAEVNFLQREFPFDIDYTVADFDNDELYRTLAGDWQREQCDARSMPFSSNAFDRVFTKSGIHEVLEEDQDKVFSEISRVLVDRGIYVAFEHILLNNEERDFYELLSHSKNAIAGFSHLIKNRHFQTQKEMFGKLGDAGLEPVVFYQGNHFYSTRNWLKGDFFGDENKLECWNEYIRRSIPNSLKEQIQYQDCGNTIRMKFSWPVIQARKK